MKKHILFTILPDTATDGVIARGTLNLLRKLYGDLDYKVIADPATHPAYIAQVHSMDRNTIANSCFHPTEHFDAIIIMGTPWIWDQFQLSHKYKNLLELFCTHPSTPRIFLGIGSALPLGHGAELMARQEDIEALQMLYSGSTIIVRDGLAQEVLLNAGLDSTLLPCPSHFCYGIPAAPQPTDTNKSVMIFYNPLTGLAADWWSARPSELYAYFNNYQRFIKEHPNAAVYIVANVPETLPDDIRWANVIGLPEPTLLKSCNETLEAVRGASVVLSGRVHCAVPARVAGAQVEILQIDSRARTLTDFASVDLAEMLEGYRNALRNFA